MAVALLQLTDAVLASSGSVRVFSYVFEVYLQGFLSIEYTFTFERLPLILVTTWSYKFRTLDQQSNYVKSRLRQVYLICQYYTIIMTTSTADHEYALLHSMQLNNS